MKHSPLRICSAGLLAVMALSMVGCEKRSAVTITLQAILAGANIAIDAVGGTPEQIEHQRGILNVTIKCVENATEVLSGTETLLEKAKAIRAFCHAAVTAVVPDGWPKTAVMAFNALIQLVEQFLETQGRPSLSVTSGVPMEPMKLTKGDVEALPKIRTAADELRVKAKL